MVTARIPVRALAARRKGSWRLVDIGHCFQNLAKALFNRTGRSFCAPPNMRVRSGKPSGRVSAWAIDGFRFRALSRRDETTLRSTIRQQHRRRTASLINRGSCHAKYSAERLLF
jgi:hypothetical protein